MKSTLTSREGVLKKANFIISSLSGLTVAESLLVLSVAIEQLVVQDEDSHNNQFNKPVNMRGPRILPSPRNLHKIEKDPELKEFILSYEEPICQTKLRQLLIERFGEERVPSRSGLSRYLRRLQRID